jgi:hypothetical protein
LQKETADTEVPAVSAVQVGLTMSTTTAVSSAAEAAAATTVEATASTAMEATTATAGECVSATSACEGMPCVAAREAVSAYIARARTNKAVTRASVANSTAIAYATAIPTTIA